MNNKYPYVHDGNIRSLIFRDRMVAFEIESKDGYMVEIEASNVRIFCISAEHIQNNFLDVEIIKVNSENITDIIRDFDYNFERRSRLKNENEILCDGKTYFLCIEPSAGLLAMILAEEIVVRWLGKRLTFGKDGPENMKVSLSGFLIEDGTDFPVEPGVLSGSQY